MRLFAFAALLALPLFAIAAPAAKADYYKCCGAERHHGGDNGYSEFRIYDVQRPAVVFGCDGYHCKTSIKLKPYTTIKARCYKGWCRIKSHQFKNAWVLEECLSAKDEEGEGEGQNEGEGQDEGEGEGGQGGYERG
jgi:hypothetical protein